MKQEVRRSRLEAMLLAILREQPGCEGAVAIIVGGHEDGTNWHVEKVDSGSSGHNECLTALRYIVSDLQKVYTLIDP